MNLFLFPQRIGNFDIIAPIFLKIKKNNPKIINYILINNEKLFQELLENMEIFEILKANCKFIKLFKLNKIYSLFIKLCILILFIFSSNRNLFSRGYDGKYEKILLVLNRIFKATDLIVFTLQF